MGRVESMEVYCTHRLRSSSYKESPIPASVWPASPAWTSCCPCRLPGPPAPPPDQLSTQWTQVRWRPSPALKPLMVPHLIQSKSKSLPTCPTLTTYRPRLILLKPHLAPFYSRAFARLSLYWEHPSPLRPGLDSRVPLSDGPSQTTGPTAPLVPSICALVPFHFAPTDPRLTHVCGVQAPPLGRKPHVSCWSSDVPPGNTWQRQRQFRGHSWGGGAGI